MGLGTADGAGLTKILVVAVAAPPRSGSPVGGHPGLGFAGHPQLPSAWLDSTIAKETSDTYRHVTSGRVSSSGPRSRGRQTPRTHAGLVERTSGSAAARNAKPKDAWSKDRSPPTGSKHSLNSPSSTPNDSTPTYDQLHLPYTEDLTGSRGQSGSKWHSGEYGRASHHQDPELGPTRGADRLRHLYLLGRVGEPEDIAAAVAFLASSDAAWITGHTLPVDGGLLTGPRACGAERLTEAHAITRPVGDP
jgi:hypothetical protein